MKVNFLLEASYSLDLQKTECILCTTLSRENFFKLIRDSQILSVTAKIFWVVKFFYNLDQKASISQHSSVNKLNIFSLFRKK